jgi:hypothetical protein
MGTFFGTVGFMRGFRSLSEDMQAKFISAAKQFSDELDKGNGFSRGLRVKKLQGRNNEWELTYAPDGRAVFQYGPEVRPGVKHVDWLSIGTHDDLF